MLPRTAEGNLAPVVTQYFGRAVFRNRFLGRCLPRLNPPKSPGGSATSCIAPSLALAEHPLSTLHVDGDHGSDVQSEQLRNHQAPGHRQTKRPATTCLVAQGARIQDLPSD
jgi:hypothetical protein